MTILVVAPPVAAQGRQAEINQLVFDLCPKMLDGTVSLTDPAQLRAIGFVLTTPLEHPSGKIPRAEKGMGENKIVIAANADICSIWFGGPDNAKLYSGVASRAGLEFFVGRGPVPFRDGISMFSFNSIGKPARSLGVVLADAGNQLDFEPATTIVMANEKGN